MERCTLCILYEVSGRGGAVVKAHDSKVECYEFDPSH